VSDRVLRIATIAERVRTAEPRCGRTRLVCVDGPSGSGKTSFAERLAAALCGPPVLHMDDLYPSWDGLADSVPLLRDLVVEPLAAGRPARYRRYDWERGEYAEEHDLGTPPALVVEGVGAASRPVAGRTVLAVWLDAPREVRFRRGIARDGETYRPYWERWARQEVAHFAADATKARADLLLDGAPTVPHDEEREVVLLPEG
jgi:uridine kinase